MSQANAERRFLPDSVPSTASVNQQLSSSKRLPTHFRIRTAQPKDLNQIVSVLLHSFYMHAKATQWLYWILRISIQEDLKAKVRAPNSQYACLVATTLSADSAQPDSAQSDSAQSDQVIGTAEMSQRACETWQFFPPPRAYLSNLAISVNYRRQGAAQQLIDTCERIAVGWGFRHVYLHVMADNLPARTLYEQAGYRLCEVSNPILSSLGLSAQRLLLSKRISAESLHTGVETHS